MLVNESNFLTVQFVNFVGSVSFRIGNGLTEALTQFNFLSFYGSQRILDLSRSYKVFHSLKNCNFLALVPRVSAYCGINLLDCQTVLWNKSLT